MRHQEILGPGKFIAEGIGLNRLGIILQEKVE